MHQNFISKLDAAKFPKDNYRGLNAEKSACRLYLECLWGLNLLTGLKEDAAENFERGIQVLNWLEFSYLQDQTTALDSKFVASVSESSDKPQNSLSISESRSSRNDSTLTHLIESQVKSLESQSSTQDASSERVRAQNKYKSREQGQSLESRTRIQKDYAKAIMQRFKFKLDGQQRQFKKSPEDFGTDTPQIQILSVREQVDKLISQATSLDNLARMYEGWTPWI